MLVTLKTQGENHRTNSMCDADSPQSSIRDLDVVIPASATADGHTQDMVGEAVERTNM